MSLIEKKLRDGLAAKANGELRLPVLLTTPYGEVRVLAGKLDGDSKAILWASRIWGKAAA